MTEANRRAVVLLVSLSHQSFFDDQYETLLNRLAAQADLKRVRKADATINFLADNAPSVVLITDEGIADKKHADVLEGVLKYTKAGGRTIVAGHFSSFVRMDEFDTFFAKWGFPWKRGNYDRSDVVLNESCARNFSLQGLPGSYSQKALKVKDVDREQALYTPGPGSKTQSHVFTPEPVDSSQAAVVLAAYGAGSLGYVGDVNDESDDVVFSMCRLG